MSTEVTVRGPAGKVAVREGLGAGLVVAGDNRSAAEMLPEATIYQGTAQEQEKYGEGKFKRGDLIHCSERRKLNSNVFVPIAGAMSWVAWPKGQKVPTYVKHDKRDVPANDLQWGPNGEKPFATQVATIVVLFLGEDTPIVLKFKRTGMRAYEQLKRYESNRDVAGKEVGSYRFESIDDKDDSGNPFKRWVIVPNGEAPEELAEGAITLRDALSVAKLTQRARESAEADTNDEPIVTTATVKDADIPV